VLWILTLINALNFMDNMNGLCGGLGLIGAWFLGMSAAIHGQYLVASLAALSAGALLGFLPYNFPKASVFLGDAGSHLVGYLLAVLAILPSFHTPDHPNTLAVLVPLLILAVPLGDLFWIGDNNHLSHRLVRRGLSKPTAVLVIWLLAGLAGIAGLLMLN
jgi:UDP-GlcNAc:undecaprenyl-phosphate/decaprenyl-phosphate GlcNAc-1-phosphate transferase